MIEWWIDIPNLKTVSLEWSFWYVKTKSITSIYKNNNEWIDVSPILADLVKIRYGVYVLSSKGLQEMDMNITNVVFISDCGNDLKELNLNKYKKLRSINIGHECFKNVNVFSIDGLTELKSILIGDGSFTNSKNGHENDPSRSFHVSNCAELGWIEIGKNSFLECGGGFELVNLPKLESIKVGGIELYIHNFRYCPFVIESIMNDILLMNRSS